MAGANYTLSIMSTYLVQIAGRQNTNQGAEARPPRDDLELTNPTLLDNFAGTVEFLSIHRELDTGGLSALNHETRALLVQLINYIDTTAGHYSSGMAGDRWGASSRRGLQSHDGDKGAYGKQAVLGAKKTGAALVPVCSQGVARMIRADRDTGWRLCMMPAPCSAWCYSMLNGWVNLLVGRYWISPDMK